MNIDEIDDKLNSIVRQRDKLIIEVNKVNEEIQELLDTKYTLDPIMERIECIQCGALGRVKREDGSQSICPTCNGRCYIWLKKFTPSEAKE